MKLQKLIKSVSDFLVAFFVLIFLTPLFLFVSFLIKLDSKGPVFFRQKRVGKSGKEFKIWKFRTMVDKAEGLGLKTEVSKNDFRITKIGGFLRRSGIDELPQVVNVVLGQMSLVGPRAALPAQYLKYTEEEKRRVQVKPGITNINILKGWNTLPWKKRIENDLQYIEDWSLWLDLKILFFTPFIVLLGRGQYGEKGVVEDYK